MTDYPTFKQIIVAQKSTPWEYGNGILYKLCRDNFEHKKIDRIIAKVLFIGRIYAAAVERRKSNTNIINDDFYIKTVAPSFRKSRIDERLMDLKAKRTVKPSDIPAILITHGYLTRLLESITDLEKRSLASKYLHFHLPEHFFIYDNRAANALRHFIVRVPADLKFYTLSDSVDKSYAKFYCKCYELKRRIRERHGIKLSNRELDNLLIKVANRKAAEKR